METPKDDPKADESSTEPSAEPAPEPAPEPDEGESYEDSWYQVLKRRAESKPKPADDQKTEE